jgi:pilus assembly protein Flp/PilA
MQPGVLDFGKVLVMGRNYFRHREADIARERNMRKTILNFWQNESGATAIEYGLIAGLIGVVVITAVTSVGTKVSNQFKTIGNALK